MQDSQELMTFEQNTVQFLNLLLIIGDWLTVHLRPAVKIWTLLMAFNFADIIIGIIV